MAKYTAIGGQALIEGIMMKSPEKTALAVRTKDNTIDVSYMPDNSLRKRFKILRAPILRGIIAYIESMLQGYKAMMLSADKSGFTDIEDEQEEKKMSEKGKNILVGAAMVIGTVLGFALAVALFMGIPWGVVQGINYIFDTTLSEVPRTAIEQLIKLAVVVIYMWAVSLMKDIRRVFMYHGAEHKTIFCYEKGLPLTVENVRGQSRFHPRCGTSFLILMILVSFLVSIAVQAIFPQVYNIGWLWVIAKILMLPIICGIGFEVLRFCGRFDNIVTRIISAPGLWMQRITTKEPTDDMIEIAIAALKACEPESPDVDRSVDEAIQETADREENDANDDI